MNLGIVASGVVPAPLGTTFNPLDKSAAFSLDATNTIVTTNNLGGGVRTVANLSGKQYAEFDAPAGALSGKLRVGIVLDSVAVASDPSVVASGYAIVWDPTDAYRVHTGSFVGIGGTPGGSRGRMAFDTATGKIWFGVGNVWYASGDPATGANPAYSGVVTTSHKVTVTATTGSGGPYVVPFYFSPAQWTGTVPSGFGPIV